MNAGVAVSEQLLGGEVSSSAQLPFVRYLTLQTLFALERVSKGDAELAAPALQAIKKVR